MINLKKPLLTVLLSTLYALRVFAEPASTGSAADVFESSWNSNREEVQTMETSRIRQHNPYFFSLRTNLLYSGLGLPTLGIEWRANQHVGIQINGSRSWWGNAKGKIQKVWILSPEVRWYLLNAKQFYVGAASNLSKYNIYKYPVGNLLSSNTGYQGKLWSLGATVGYQLSLSKCLSADFNVGLGYIHSEYDSFILDEGVRTYKDKNKTKNVFGLSQAGVSLVWRIGSK